MLGGHTKKGGIVTGSRLTAPLHPRNQGQQNRSGMTRFRRFLKKLPFDTGLCSNFRSSEASRFSCASMIYYLCDGKTMPRSGRWGIGIYIQNLVDVERNIATGGTCANCFLEADGSLNAAVAESFSLVWAMSHAAKHPELANEDATFVIDNMCYVAALKNNTRTRVAITSANRLVHHMLGNLLNKCRSVSICHKNLLGYTHGWTPDGLATQGYARYEDFYTTKHTMSLPNPLYLPKLVWKDEAVDEHGLITFVKVELAPTACQFHSPPILPMPFRICP